MPIKKAESSEVATAVQAAPQERPLLLRLMHGPRFTRREIECVIAEIEKDIAARANTFCIQEGPSMTDSRTLPLNLASGERVTVDRADQ